MPLVLKSIFIFRTLTPSCDYGRDQPMSDDIYFIRYLVTPGQCALKSAQKCNMGPGSCARCALFASKAKIKIFEKPADSELLRSEKKNRALYTLLLLHYFHNFRVLCPVWPEKNYTHTLLSNRKVQSNCLSSKSAIFGQKNLPNCTFFLI